MDILGLAFPGWLAVLLTLFLTLYIYGRYKHSYFTFLGIHCIPGVFMLGDFPTVMTKGFNYIDADLIKKHGKVFGIYMGNQPSLVVCDTDMMKEITVKQFHKFTDRNPVGPMHKRWRSGLLIAEGNHWKFLRTTLSPSFSVGKLRNMCPIIEHCLHTLHSIVDVKVKEHPDGFDITPLMDGLTMDVFCNCGFGMQVDAQTDQDNFFVQHAKKMLDDLYTLHPVIFLNALFPELGFILNLFPFNFIPMSSYEYLKSVTMSAFAERKQSESSHKDLLQLMINAHKGEDQSNEECYTYEDFKKRGLTDEEVLVNTIIFLSSGYDTTASALAWCVYDLVLHPKVQDKLIQEIDAELVGVFPNYDNVDKLRYLEMVMNETLRMHPPIGRFDRNVTEDTEVNGILFKKGLNVSFPTVAIHYMPDYWENPNEFIPERDGLLYIACIPRGPDATVRNCLAVRFRFDPENQYNINPYAYVPFGLGPRNCVAMKLAKLEFKMTIASLLQKWRLVKTDTLQIPMPFNMFGITRPVKPVTIKAIPRKI